MAALGAGACDGPGDRGFVQVDRQIGWPPRHEVITDTRTITVPRGTFATASPVLGLVETPISETDARVEVPIGVLGDPVVNADGHPVPWTRLGVKETTYDAIIDAWRQPAVNDGGRRQQRGRHVTSRDHDSGRPEQLRAPVVPTIPDLPVTIDGQDRMVRLRPIGRPETRVRQVWARPADRTGGWRLERVRLVDDRVLIDDLDVTDWRIGSVKERTLLRSVTDALEAAATTGIGAAGDIDRCGLAT